MRDRIINIFTFAVLTLLWLGFAVAFLFNPDTLDTPWQAFRSWPLLLRLVLVLGLAWVTVYTFFPRKISNQVEASASKP